VWLSDFFVAPGGSDTNAGTAASPWQTLQSAANQVKPGDTVHAAAGNYAAFVLGWDGPQSGTAAAPITFKADPGAVISARNKKTPHAIDLESSNYIVIDSNTVFGNGRSALGGISLDGVESSRIVNNLVYGNGFDGALLYRADAASGSSNNKLINNTIVNSKVAMWAVRIANQSTGNELSNNILYSACGSINISRDSMSGPKSDYNILTNNFSTAGTLGAAANGQLAQWQSLTQGDAHSFIASPSSIFANHLQNDYRLSSGSGAVDKGTAAAAPNVDILGTPRPYNGRYDIGDYELVQGSKPTSTQHPASNPRPSAFAITLRVKAVKGGRANAFWSYRTKTKRKFSYLLERSINGRKLQSLGKFSGASAQKSADSGLKKNRKCFYRVRAFAKKTKTQWSPMVTIRGR